MDFRKYSAELVGSFIFFVIGYLSVPAFAKNSKTIRWKCSIPIVASIATPGAWYGFDLQRRFAQYPQFRRHRRSARRF